MLDHIFIKNFTIIDELSLDFNAGMTVITGETGAGKSIIIDAIEFALGERATVQLIRKNQSQAEVVLSFSQIEETLGWLKTHDLAHDDECIIRRLLNDDGRSRYTINGVPITAKLSREFSELLISIHGQHAHQALLNQQEQRRMIDSYANHHTMLTQIADYYQQWKSLNDQLHELERLNSRDNNPLDYIDYQVNEIKELQLKPNEVESLHQEYKKLNSSETLKKSCEKALELLTRQPTHNILSRVHQAIAVLNAANAITPVVSNCVDLLKQASIYLDEASTELQHLSIDSDENRLAAIENRLNRIHDIARKHRANPEELTAVYQRFVAEKYALENSEKHIAAVHQQLHSLQKKYTEVAEKLTKSREKNIRKLNQLITEQMQHLSMIGGECRIECHTLLDDKVHITGNDTVIFTIKTNPGESFYPLQKIVSGGELSRISLAIQVIMAQKCSVPCLVFDEVDVGIGGKTAEIVGNLLHDLAKRNQLLCITHLPQVAASGDHHIAVIKETSKNSTRVTLKTLHHNERIDEIARMLGGVKITSQTLAHAKEMLG